jgi:hypothetical protein
LPEAAGEAMEALLTDRLAEAAREPVVRTPPPPPRPAVDIERALSAAPALREAPSTPLPPLRAVEPEAPALVAAPVPVPTPAPVASAPAGEIADVVRELAASEGATFRPAPSLFRDFAIRCRQSGIASAHVDLAAFRRLFAFALAGTDRLGEPLRGLVEQLGAQVDDDVLAPYLALVIAAATGSAMPDEEELGRLYGSASPSRVRRLLAHLERLGLIVVREDFGGERSITVPGIAAMIDEQNRIALAS